MGRKNIRLEPAEEEFAEFEDDDPGHEYRCEVPYSIIILQFGMSNTLFCEKNYFVFSHRY